MEVWDKHFSLLLYISLSKYHINLLVVLAQFLGLNFYLNIVVALKVFNIGDRSCISLAWAIPVFIETFTLLIHHSAPNHYNFAWMMVVLLEQLNSTNFLRVVSRCSSVKIHELDLQSFIPIFLHYCRIGFITGICQN